MRKTLIALIAAIQLIVLGFAVMAILAPTASAGSAEVTDIPGCYWDTEQRAVLIDHPIVVSPSGSANTFTCYMKAFLKRNTTIMVTVAVLVVVFSGAQYMLAMGNATNQGKAKTRVIGVATGVVFLTLIQFILFNVVGVPRGPAVEEAAEEQTTAEVCPLDAEMDGGDGISALFGIATAKAAGEGDSVASQPAGYCYYQQYGFTKGWYQEGKAGFNSVPMIKQINHYGVPYPNPNGALCTKNNINKPCTIATSGCGIVSATMVLRFRGVTAGVGELAQYALRNSFRPNDAGTKPTFFRSIAENKGLKYTLLKDWDDIVLQLKAKNPVIVSGNGSAPYTPGGHYVVLTGYDSVKKKVYVNDPWGGQERDNQAYDESQIRGGMRTDGERGGHLITR